MKRLRRLGLILWLSLCSLTSIAAGTNKPPITVFAAASLTNVAQELGDGFAKETSIPVRFSFAASSALARQIENGAPADVFFSADLEWMDYLQTRNLIRHDTRHNVLSNRLVLIAPTDSKIKLKIEPGFHLADVLGRVVDHADQPDADRHRRVPVCVDHALHILAAHLVEVLHRALVDRRVVVQDHLRPVRSDAGHLFRPVAEPGVILVRGPAKTSFGAIL